MKKGVFEGLREQGFLKYVFEISNVHNERNINLKFVILVRIRLNGFSGDCKRKK